MPGMNIVGSTRMPSIFQKPGTTLALLSKHNARLNIVRFDKFFQDVIGRYKERKKWQNGERTKTSHGI